jgi:hypothetical protein
VFPRRNLLIRAAIVLSAAVCVLAVVAVVGLSNKVEARGPLLRADPNTGPFKGLGAWIDIFDKTSWRRPEQTVKDLASRGVKTLYLQTGNNSQKLAIVKSKGVVAFLDAAHAEGIQVVAWYLPGLTDPAMDLQRADAAIAFRTPSGNAFAGFGLDIESPAVSDPFVRTARLLQLSDQIRAFAGQVYPLAAIIPSPHGMTVHTGYWPNFPYTELALRYDAFLPMAYYTWRDKSTLSAGGYIDANIRILRQAVGSDAVPIHIIGGIAQESALVGVRSFVNAVLREKVLGESLYSYPGVTPDMWTQLARAH